MGCFPPEYQPVFRFDHLAEQGEAVLTKHRLGGVAIDERVGSDGLYSVGKRVSDHATAKLGCRPLAPERLVDAVTNLDPAVHWCVLEAS